MMRFQLFNEYVYFFPKSLRVGCTTVHKRHIKLLLSGKKISVNGISRQLIKIKGRLKLAMFWDYEPIMYNFLVALHRKLKQWVKE